MSITETTIGPLEEAISTAWETMSHADIAVCHYVWINGPTPFVGLHDDERQAILSTGLVFDLGEYFSLTDFGIAVMKRYFPVKELTVLLAA